MKCTACGFDTPEEQGYCDFCKEPFRKPEQPALPPARKLEDLDQPAAKPAEKVPLTPEMLAKLMQAGISPKTPAPASGEPLIPPEFAHLDSGEKLPQIPPAARKLAWVFLGICVLWILAGTAWLLMNSERIAAGAAKKSRPPRSAPAIP